MDLPEQLQASLEELRRGVRYDENFEVLARHFYPQIQRLVASKVRGEQDQLDLTQEILLRVYRGLKGFRWESQIGTWIFTITRNTCMRYLKRHRTDVLERSPRQFSRQTDDLPRTPDEFLNEIPSDSSDQLQTLLTSERSAALRAAIEKLPAQMQRCVRLRVEQGLKYQEIATVLLLSQETVKTQLNLARSRLRSILKEDLGGTPKNEESR